MAAASIVQRGAASITWRPTPWDADGLGVAATLEVTALTGADPGELAAALAELDQHAAAAGAALVTTRVPAAATATLAALAAAGWATVETSHPLTLALTGQRFGRAVAVADASAADAAELADLAGDGFDYSRFHEDPRIHPSRARARYRRWIVDSLGNGDAVWLHRHRGALAALMSFRRTGDHVQLLLGGCARDLTLIAPMFWAGVLARLAAEGVATIATRVSAANAGALRLHEAFGFVRAGTDLGLTKLYDPSALASPLAARAAPSTAERT